MKISRKMYKKGDLCKKDEGGAHMILGPKYRPLNQLLDNICDPLQGQEHDSMMG
jgi:hypothetical protein